MFGSRIIYALLFHGRIAYVKSINRALVTWICYASMLSMYIYVYINRNMVEMMAKKYRKEGNCCFVS